MARVDDDMSSATSKKPPSWSPEQKDYSFRDFTRDLILWEQATDLREGQKGPAVALQLRGEAREVVRDLDARELSLGRVDAQGNPTHTGVEVIIEELQRRFGPLNQSRAIEVVENFLSFKRKKGDSVDLTIAKFEEAYRKARQEGGLTLNAVGLSYIISQILNLSAEELLVLLNDFRGGLPQDEPEYRRFTELLRRHQGRQERAREGRGPLNFSGDHRPQRPNYPTWSDYLGEEDWSANADECLEEEEWAWYGDTSWWEQEPEYDEYWEEVAEEEAHLEEDPLDEALGEEESEAYLAYLAARKNWRRYKGKSKGKGKSSSSSGAVSSFGGGSAKGKGKPGKGKGKAYPGWKGHQTQNPKGSDGKPLKCSICGSTQHLRMRCPKAKGKSKGAPFQRSDQATSTSSFVTWTVSQSWMVGPSSNAAREPMPTDGGEGIIPDTGAIPNLCGRAWLNRMKKEGAKIKTRPSTGNPLYGVGGSSPQVLETATVWLRVPVRNKHGKRGQMPITFTAEVLDQPSVPALLGLNSMMGHRASINNETRQMTVKTEDGEHVYIDLLQANSGHLMVPILASNGDEHKSTTNYHIIADLEVESNE